jgi:WD40 repeat protein
VALLLAAVEENVPADLAAFAGQGVALDKSLTVLARQLEEKAYKAPWAKWAVEAWAFALDLIPEERLSPAPWQADPKQDMWALALWQRVFAYLLALLAFPVVWALNGVYGWALGCIFAWWAAGEMAMRPGGVIGLTLFSLAYALACSLSPKARHPWVRGFFMMAPAGVVVAAAWGSPTMLVLAVLVCPAVAFSSIVLLLLARRSVGLILWALLVATAFLVTGLVGTLAGTLVGWVAGGALAVAVYHGLYAFLEARASRAERPARWVARQTLMAVGLGILLGAGEASLGYAIVTGYVENTLPIADGTSGTRYAIAIESATWAVSVQVFLWLWLLAAVAAGSRKLSKPKPRAKGGELFEKHTGPIRAVAFSANGCRILSGSDDGSTRLWDVETRRTWRRFPGRGRGGACSGVLFLPGEGQILTTSGPTLCRWDAESGLLLDRLRFRGGRSVRLSVSLASYPTHLLIGHFIPGRDHWHLFRPALTAGALPRVPPTHEKVIGHRAVTVVSFSPDNRLAVSAGEDGDLRLWDIEGGVEVHRLSGHREAVNAVGFSHDGGLLVSTDDDGRLRFWDVRAGKLLDVLNGHVREALCVCFSPARDRLVSGGADRAARLWDVAERRELRRFEGEDGRRIGVVHCVAFAPDGRSFATGGADHLVRLWQIPPDGELAATALDVPTAIREGVAPYHRERGITRPPRGQK